MYDYDGDMEYYAGQLRRAGITEKMFDITNYVGCTAEELQRMVNAAIRQAKEKGLI